MLKRTQETQEHTLLLFWQHMMLIPPFMYIDAIMQRYNTSPDAPFDEVLERCWENIESARAAARERARKSAELAHTEVQAGLATPEQIKEMVVNQMPSIPSDEVKQNIISDVREALNGTVLHECACACCDRLVLRQNCYFYSFYSMKADSAVVKHMRKKLSHPEIVPMVTDAPPLSPTDEHTIRSPIPQQLLDYHSLQHKSPTLANMLLSPRGYTASAEGGQTNRLGDARQDFLVLCDQCKQSLYNTSTQSPPKFSIANGNFIGELDQDLFEASDIENMLASPVHLRTCILTLQGGSYTAMKGHALTYIGDVEQTMQTLLPREPSHVLSKINIFIAKGATEVQRLDENVTAITTTLTSTNNLLAAASVIARDGTTSTSVSSMSSGPSTSTAPTTTTTSTATTTSTVPTTTTSSTTTSTVPTTTSTSPCTLEPHTRIEDEDDFLTLAGLSVALVDEATTDEMMAARSSILNDARSTSTSASVPLTRDQQRMNPHVDAVHMEAPLSRPTHSPLASLLRPVPTNNDADPESLDEVNDKNFVYVRGRLTPYLMSLIS